MFRIRFIQGIYLRGISFNCMDRIKEWDFIKGILIFCVIYGHINAYLTPISLVETSNYSPTLIIRLFQMPLFVLVSGHFCKTVSTFSAYLEIWKRYLTRLGLPYISWSLILTLIKCLVQGDFSTFLLDFRESFGLLWFIPMLLISHFVFTTYTVILSKFRIFNRVSVLFLLIVHLIISMLMYRDFCNFFFLFPFYIAGYFLKKVDIHALIGRYRWGVSILLLLSVIICANLPNSWTFYQASNYIEVFDVQHIMFVVLRYICYAIVTLTVLLLLFKVYTPFNRKSNGLINRICQIGKEETLFLYLAHISLLYYTLRVFVLDNESSLLGILGNQFVRSYIISIIVFAVLVVLLTLLFKILSKSVYTKKIFIG